VIHLGSSLAALVLVWLLHVMWFRLSPPRTRVQGLLKLFSVGFVVLVSGFVWAGWQRAGGPVGGVPLPATALVLYVLASLAYIIIYTAVEVDSPSALIVLLMRERGDQGMTFSDLREVLTDDNLVMARMRDLVAVGSVSDTGTQFRLEPRGLLIARVFAIYRGLLGRGLGG
jgi:hypothetical protein